MRPTAAICLFAGTILVATPAFADPLPAERGKDWLHKETGLAVPASSGGFERVEAQDFGKTQSDISFQYVEPQSRTFITLYLFRAGLVDPSIWADRIEATILANTSHYTIDPKARAWTRFTPTTGGTDSAIRFVYPATGPTGIATGAAIEARGDWLIAARLTSKTLLPTDADARLAQFMRGLPFGPVEAAPATAYAIAECSEGLDLKPAQPAPSDLTEALLGATIQGMVADGKGNEVDKRQAKPFCRDPASQPGFGIFRKGGAKDGYVIAAGDAGVSIVVGGTDLAGLLSGKATPKVGVTLYTTDMAYGFPAYRSVPTPQQAMSVLETGKPAWSTSRIGGKNRAINLDMPGK